MAYTVLARRYRSASFDDLVGQGHIAKTLKRAIESNRIAHAFLFCGTRGTGKTSTARILAKCLNCQSADHPVTTPCDKCDSCISIARGDDIDVIEIDAASNTGVDDVRDTIIGTAYNTPARSRFKIFIIDEVHMLSKNAFNALLKTLEEPPAHVKFILATTEPEKVLPTILSRCQRYDFRNIPAREIAAHLKSICGQEKISADEDALLLVAKAGAGSMRDSLSLLDRLLSLGEKKLTVQLIEQLLGLPAAELIFNLTAAVASGNVKSVLSQTEAIIAGGQSLDGLLAALVDHLRNLMILRACGPGTDLVEIPGLSAAELDAQAGKFDPAALSQDIVLLEELRRHARHSQAGRALLDATLVRLTLADQFSSIPELLLHSDHDSPSADAQKKKPVDTPAPILKPNPPASPPVAEPQVDDDGDSLPGVGKVWEGARPSLSTLLARQSSPAPQKSPESNIEPINPGDLPAQWQAMLSLLAKKGPSLHGILSQGRFIGIQDGMAVVTIAKAHETFIRRLDGNKQVISNIFSQVVAEPVGVRFQLEEAAPQAEAISQNIPAAKAAQPVAAVAAIEPVIQTQRITEELRARLYETNPLIRAVVDQLGGTVVKLED